jgi:hypothetical protein
LVGTYEHCPTRFHLQLSLFPLEYDGQAAYMDAHPKSLKFLVVMRDKVTLRDKLIMITILYLTSKMIVGS